MSEGDPSTSSLNITEDDKNSRLSPNAESKDKNDLTQDVDNGTSDLLDTTLHAPAENSNFEAATVSRGLMDLPNEMFAKILNQLKYKDRDKVRLLCKSLRNRVTVAESRFGKYKIKLKMNEMPENELWYQDDTDVELDLYFIDGNDPLIERLGIWLRKSSHRIVKLKGPPPVLNKVSNFYVNAPRLADSEIMGKKLFNRVLNFAWQPNLVKLWLECTDITVVPDQLINIPNLKILHLRDVIFVSSDVESLANNKKIKSDSNLGLATVLNSCRTTLEYIELFTTDLSGILHFQQDLPALKQIRLVRITDAKGIIKLLETCQHSLETIETQEMDLNCLTEFQTPLTALKNIDSDNDKGVITLLKNCSTTLETLDIEDLDNRINFVDLDPENKLCGLKTVKANRPRGIFGLQKLMSLAYRTLEVIDLEQVNLAAEIKEITFELPALKKLKTKKCAGESLIIKIMRIAKDTIEHVDVGSLYCPTPTSINFDMPNLKMVIIDQCNYEVSRVLQVRCHPDARIYVKNRRHHGFPFFSWEMNFHDF